MLRIYIADHCFGCEAARLLYTEIRTAYPDMDIELLTLDDEVATLPEGVVAVPAYVLDGEVIFLGNPKPGELLEKLGVRQELTRKDL